MSVSAKYTPIALALRFVMGKENFDEWFESLVNLVPTMFKSEQELISTVKKAGFDAEQYRSSIQTQFDNGQDYLFWELKNKTWTAIFNYDPNDDAIQDFIAQIEHTAGRKIFDLTELSPSTQDTSTKYPTNFNDGQLLAKALWEFGAHPQQHDNGKISCQIDQAKLIFSQEGDSPFYVEVKNCPDIAKLYHHLSDLDEDYRRCLQTAVYERVKANAQDRGLIIESEEVLEDKTILMTLQVT